MTEIQLSQQFLPLSRAMKDAHDLHAALNLAIGDQIIADGKTTLIRSDFRAAQAHFGHVGQPCTGIFQRQEPSGSRRRTFLGDMGYDFFDVPLG